jgi:ribose transport system ATP-binding protein
MALLEVDNVTKRFPGVQALTDVSLTVELGEAHALVGQNGAGKSTLVKCITGVQPPDEGRIVFDGVEIEGYGPKTVYHLGIAAVYQRMQLLPHLSVAENILLGQMPTVAGGAFINRAEANRSARALLERFRLDINPEMPVVRLGPAERQQVAIAKALFRRAKLLILDEPTAALDARRIDRLFELIGDLKTQGVAVLYISHHLEEVFRMADRITILRDSQVVTTRPATELDQSEVVTLMAGRRIETGIDTGGEADLESVAQHRTPILEFRQVSAGALRDITFSVDKGEVVGITGVIGAGGSDIARILYGLSRPEAGTMMLEGKSYASGGPRQSLRRGLFMVPEDPTGEGLVPPLSVATNITLVDLPAFTKLGVLSLGREKKVARQYVDQLTIKTSSVNTAVRNLSGGNQQKVLLAKSLEAKSRVLVLLEPTQGVDVAAKADIHKIIRQLASQGKAVLVISTDIRDLLLFVDRILAIRAGRIVADKRTLDTNYAEVLDLTVGSVAARAS